MMHNTEKTINQGTVVRLRHLFQQAIKSKINQLKNRPMIDVP